MTFKAFMGYVRVPYECMCTSYLISKKGVRELRHDTRYTLWLKVDEKYVLLVEQPYEKCFKTDIGVKDYLSVIEFEKCGDSLFVMKSYFWSRFHASDSEPIKKEKFKVMDKSNLEKLLYKSTNKISKIILLDKRIRFMNGNRELGSRFIDLDSPDWLSVSHQIENVRRKFASLEEIVDDFRFGEESLNKESSSKEDEKLYCFEANEPKPIHIIVKKGYIKITEFNLSCMNGTYEYIIRERVKIE